MDAVAHTSETLVGRDAELTEIASLLGVLSSSAGERAARPAIVLLSGDAGVGKTRLLMELRDLAQAEGWQVVAGHCLDFGDSALPYLPFSEVLGRLAAELPDVVDQVAVRPPRPGPAPARAPGPLRATSSDDGDEPTARSTAPTCSRPCTPLLEAAAEQAPLLARGRGRPLGRPVDPRPAQLPVLPAVRRAGRARRVLPLRRPPPPPPAPPAGRRVGPAPRRRPPPAQPAAETSTCGALVAALRLRARRRDRARDIVGRAEGNAFFVEELVGAAAPAGGCPTTSPTSCSSGSTGSTTTPARWSGSPASPAARSPTTCSPPPPASTSRALDEALRKAVEMNVLVAGAGRYSFRHALLGEAVYDDLLPGERVRLHAEYAAALGDGRVRGTAAELARHARLAKDLDTALSAGDPRPATRPLAVGGPDEAAQHYRAGARAARRPRPARALDIDLSKLAVDASEALTASGDPERAATRAPRAARPAAGRRTSRATWRPRMLSASAPTRCSSPRPTIDPLPISPRRSTLSPEGESGLRAKVLAVHARILGGYGDARRGAVGRHGRARARRAARPAELASDVITTLSGLKKAGPREGLRAP